MRKIVTLYTNGCPKCKILEAKLRDKNIEFYEITDTQKMLNMGLSTVPWLEVDGEMLNFSQANEWVNNQ